MVGCSSFWTKPIPTAQPTETPIIPTTTPFAAPTPTPTISPTPTVNPTPTPIPTFIPTPVPTQNIRELFPRVTKSPTSEVVKEGGSCYFIANYENATIAVYNIRAFNWWFGKSLLAIESTDNEKIDSCNATYYISDKILKNMTNFTEIKNFDNIHIYGRVT